MPRSLLALTALALLTLVGCNGPTYVNIPAQAGDLAVNDPNSQTVREVVAAALKGMLLRKEVAPPIAVKLPEGATPLTHADVARRIGPDAVSPSEEGVEPASTLTVRGITIRGGKAQVDVVAPGPSGLDQLTTVRLEWSPMAGWNVRDTRTWRTGAHTVMMPVQAAPPESP